MNHLARATTLVRRLVDVALIGLIGVVLGGLVLGKLLPLTGQQAIIVGGGSMEPTLPIGAAIVVAPVDPAALAVGHVVTVRVGPQQTMFTHRIEYLVERADGRWIRTRGDANPEPDPTLVPATAVVGRLVATLPWAGYLLILLSTPTGLAFVLGMAATLLAIAWLLESLELDRTQRTLVRVEPPASPGRLGEPIASRALVARSLAAAGPTGEAFRLTVADQRATEARAARARRTRRGRP